MSEEKTMGDSIYRKLHLIQQELKAPKGQYNSFSKYNYRSAEDILEALKPLLGKYGCAVRLTDYLDHIGDRYYVLSYAEITDVETGSSLGARAYAREDETKKGMDESQITGAASSYARKYALNGLFAIDDTKDADALNQPEKQPSRASADPLRSAKIRLAKAIDAWAERTGNDAAATKKSVPTMPGHAETVDWYLSTAKQFEEAK